MSGLCQDTSLRAPFLLNSRKVLQFASMSQLTTKQPEWERKIIVKKVDCIMVDPWEFLVRILKVHPSICLCASWMTACEAIRYMYLLNIAESFFSTQWGQEDNVMIVLHTAATLLQLQGGNLVVQFLTMFIYILQ